MKKIVFGFVIFLLLLIFAGLNLGKWIDATEKAVKSDIVVCLGGGTIDRVKKSIDLMKNGYILENKLLLLGESWYNQPYIKKNYPALSVDVEESPKNTVEEVLFIKKYMKEHGYNSALVVTDPPHSRRVNMLLSSIVNDREIRFCVVDSDVKWWDRENYYKSKRARSSVMHEVPRIIYTRFTD